MKRVLLCFLFIISFCIGFAQISAGETSDFEVDIEGWSHQISNPNDPVVVTTGGPNGVGDGYLSNTSSGTNGAGSRHIFANDNSEWTGDYTAAGIIAITFDVRNPNTTDLHLRVAVQGNPGRWAASLDAVVIPGNTGWTNVVLPIEATDLTLTANPSTPIATILTEVSQIRILSNDGSDSLHKGQIIALESHYDNISATNTLSTSEIGQREPEMMISPNPAKDKLNIALPQGSGDTNIEVFDVLGKRVYKGQLTQLEASVNISNWRSGVYLVRISNDQGTQTKRFIKH